MAFLKKKEKPKEATPLTPPPPKMGMKAMRGLKIMEEKFSNLDQKFELIENNILSINKRHSTEIKTMNARLLQVEQDILSIKNRFVQMAGDLKNFSRREEVDTLKKYLDYWEPLNFVTKRQLEEELEKRNI